TAYSSPRTGRRCMRKGFANAPVATTADPRGEPPTRAVGHGGGRLRRALGVRGRPGGGRAQRRLGGGRRGGHGRHLGPAVPRAAPRRGARGPVEDRSAHRPREPPWLPPGAG